MPVFFLSFWRDSPQWARASSFTRFLGHTQRRTTVSRTPLDEWSPRRRDLYLTTHNNHNKHPCPRWDSKPQSQQAAAADLHLSPRGRCDRPNPGIKEKWSRYRPGVAQRVGRDIALLFHDRGTGRGWVVSSTPRPWFTPRERPGTQFTGGWVGPRADLDGRKISSPPGLDPRPSSP